MSPRSLEEIIYFASYVVLEPGNTLLEKKQLLSEREYRERKLYGNGFNAEMGAEAIKKLLRDVDLDKEVSELKEALRSHWPKADACRSSFGHSGSLRDVW